MGLAIAAAIVSAHGGTLTAESNAGGTTFYVEL
ncbi:MAG: cell wall metabolism sensor histidine kinase WalK [Spirochaetaceae bacterium]|nr:cell wall metabolism sensor histidine kinase WalK [Spirochaetaceae bacterium]